MNLDIVIPYVNSEDPSWQLIFKTNVDIETFNARLDPSRLPQGVGENRFRDFGTFKYLLRGVDVCCPWVHRVYIILQQPSQKPTWLKESDKLKVIYHDQIIPQEYLPTFNSATIELFAWRIPGLSERYLYLNDDTFPLHPLRPIDFFDSKGRPRIRMNKIEINQNVRMSSYGKMLKNSELTALMASDTDNDCDLNVILRDTHTWSPMKKSVWKKLFTEVGPTIYNSITPFRNSKNIVQQIHSYYEMFVGDYAPLKVDGRIETFLNNSPEEIAEKIVNKSHDIICINDTGVKDYESTKNTVIQAFEKIYPEPSQFEI